MFNKLLIFQVVVPRATSRRRARTVDFDSPVTKEVDPEYYNVVMTKFRKLHLLETDPRSPTTGILRTPIEVCVGG